MTRHVSLRLGLCAGALFATSLVSAQAEAADKCSTITEPGTKVFVAGSSAIGPALPKLSEAFAKQGIRLLYQSKGSCVGLQNVLAGKGMTDTATYWKSDGTPQTCDPDETTGHVPEIALSDVYASTCGETPTNEFYDFQGPIQVMNFIVPPSSKEKAISAEAAVVVYGFGGPQGNDNQIVLPWNNHQFIFQRDIGSGTRRMIGSAIGLELGKWRGNETGITGSGAILSAVHNADATNANQAIGILASDSADKNRTGANNIKILAFQPKGQTCAYYPDSTGSTANFDKVNVREGKYPIWGPLHIVTKVNAGTSTPVNPQVATIVKYFTREGLTDDQKKDMIDRETESKTIPQCAMKVKRNGEVTANDSVTPYTPSEPCGCYFEFKANGKVPASCTTCDTTHPCATGTCRYGYCEAK